MRELGIDDLHFHDLRHEGTSRLFEAGLTIEQVALVTGHKDWKMLRRYTNFGPEHLHTLSNQPIFGETCQKNGKISTLAATVPRLPANVVLLQGRRAKDPQTPL